MQHNLVVQNASVLPIASLYRPFLMAFDTTVARLAAELDDLAVDLASVIGTTPTHWVDKNAGMFVLVGVPDYRFGPPSDVQRQHRLKARYEVWFERFALLFRHAPADVAKRVADADKEMRKWIELDDNYRIGPDNARNVEATTSVVGAFRGLLAIHTGQAETLVVPDTNALTTSPDPVSYASLAGTPTFVFVLLPTVLAELDNLKNHARDPAYRTKVNDVIRRIKGWRNQGSLLDGVRVHQTITVKAVPQEPRVEDTLRWLDPSNRDDRIVASCLELQIAAPCAAILLVTSDVNLQNKAEAARLPCAETP